MTNPTIRRRILNTTPTLTTDQLGRASLADLRDALDDLPRPDIDQALHDLAIAREIDLEPEVIRKLLTNRERTAAIHLGGEDHHYLTLPR
jgi:hypothetical protein